MNDRQLVQMPHSNAAPKAEAAQRATSRYESRRFSSPLVWQTTAAPGQSIDPATRSFMESRFGHDFSHVRIHTGSCAAQLTAGYDALAATTGRDVYFSQEAYAPTTPQGQTILAHELAHVIQIDRRGQHPPAAPLSLESEALTAALQVASGQAAHVQLAAGNQPVLTLSRTWKSILIGAAVGVAALGIAAVIELASFGLVNVLGSLGGGGLVGYAIERLRRGVRTIDTPAEADAVIQDQYGANIQRAIAANYIPAGRSARMAEIEIVDEQGFQRAYQLRYGQIDADYPRIAGFVDESVNPPRIWIHYGRKRPTTLIHECIHYYSLPARGRGFLSFGFNVNEGTTEYFTRQVAQKNKIPTGSAYQDQYEGVQALVTALGSDEPLRRAYFEGQLNELRLAVDQARGPGAFSRWAAAMQAGQWAAAQSALQTGNST